MTMIFYKEELRFRRLEIETGNIESQLEREREKERER